MLFIARIPFDFLIVTLISIGIKPRNAVVHQLVREMDILHVPFHGTFVAKYILTNVALDFLFVVMNPFFMEPKTVDIGKG